MTLHLGTIGHGVDEPLDVGDQLSWANDQLRPSVHKSLTAVFTTNHSPIHGDAEKQWDKVGIKITKKSPSQLPLPQLTPKQSFSSCPDPVFLHSRHVSFFESLNAVLE